MCLQAGSNNIAVIDLLVSEIATLASATMLLMVKGVVGRTAVKNNAELSSLDRISANLVTIDFAFIARFANSSSSKLDRRARYLFLL